MKLYEPQTIKLIKNKYGFRFSKSLGQNFLTDKGVIDAIADGAGVTEEDLVIEIGPGIGVLTQELSARAGKVVAIEIDRGLSEIMKYTLKDCENVKVVVDNVLKTDLRALIEEEKGDLTGVKIVGNLPYYITSAIITKLLKEKTGAESVTVMMQKEVAERLLSGPGSRTYGAITVAVSYYADAVPVADVPKTCFMPRPKVDSEVIRLDLLDKPRVSPLDEDRFFAVVRAAFSMRRKTLLNSLRAAGLEKDDIRSVLGALGIDVSRRAETLSIEEFAAVSDEIVRRGL